ncbi:DNA repair and recombination protein [Venturia nashicola]|nr:DNA repair and recombination protein [Venturia nashicola]
MRTFLWPLALLASSVVAMPVAGNFMPHPKRQLPQQGIPSNPPIPKQMSMPLILAKPGLMKDIQPLVDAQVKNASGRFMGTPEAYKALTAMAKLMGATKTSAGKLYEFNIEELFTEYGITADPPEAKSVSRKQVSESKTGIPNAKAVKIRYGPYKIPSVKTANKLGQNGMLANFPHINGFDKPCDDDCTIIGMRQGLEYGNGSNANINSGLWLHHSVIFAIGQGRQDPACMQYDVSIPHISVNTTAFQSERIFSNGNERTDAVFPDMGHKDVGYKIRASDKFAGLLEIMNENPKVEVVYFTMIWDILDGHPLPYEPLTIWHDVRNCGTSEVNPPDGKDKFTLESTLTAPLTAEILGSIGHVHDGGTSTSLYLDGQKLACQSDAQYGTTPDFISTSMGDEMSGMQTHANAAGTMKHVSNMGTCTAANGLTVKRMEKGQKWVLKAEYDFRKWPGMKGEDGKWDEVMGIHVMYVKKPKSK